MKLRDRSSSTKLHGFGEATEFKMKMSSVACNILSSGLYSNKIKSIIRELSTNAYDSHVEAGKKDEPFEVHLPTQEEPYFSIKDFGIGLTRQEMIDLFCTYFSSSKTDSNETVGAFGLGSKSFFSYTDQASITCVKDGIKNVCLVSFNKGSPKINPVAIDEETDEGNGVEISFATELKDIQSFSREAVEIYSWFKVKPNINVDLSFHDVLDINCFHGEDWFFANRYIGRQSWIIQGQVAYPIDFTALVNQQGDNKIIFNKTNMTNSNFTNEHIKRLLSSSIVIQAPIGTIDVTASRESISYTPETAKYIKNRLRDVYEELYEEFTKRIDNDTIWETVKAANKMQNSREFGAFLNHYTSNDQLDTGFKINSKWVIRLFTKYHIIIPTFSSREYEIEYGNRVRSRESCRYNHNSGRHELTFEPRDNLLFVVNDSPSAATRVSNYIRNENSHAIVHLIYTISPDGQQKITDPAEMKKFVDEIIAPKKARFASEFPLPERAKRKKIAGYCYDTTKSVSERLSDRFVKIPDISEYEKDHTKLYLVVKNYNIYFKKNIRERISSGTFLSGLIFIDSDIIKTMAKHFGLTQIVCIRKSDIDKFEKNGWEELTEKYLADIESKNPKIKELMFRKDGTNNGYQNYMIYKLSDLTKEFGDIDCEHVKEMRKFIDTYDKYKDVFRVLGRFCDLESTIEKNLKRIKDIDLELSKKYPILNDINCSYLTPNGKKDLFQYLEYKNSLHQKGAKT